MDTLQVILTIIPGLIVAGLLIFEGREVPRIRERAYDAGYDHGYEEACHDHGCQPSAHEPEEYDYLPATDVTDLQAYNRITTDRYQALSLDDDQ